MRTIFIILFIILTIWSIFSFDTARINLVARYYMANLSANPIKISFYTFCAVLLTITVFIVIYKGIAKPIRSQVKAIEPAFINFKDFNIKVNGSKTTSEYVKIYERLRATNKKCSVKEQILKFIDDNRFFYTNYPMEFKNNPSFNQQYSMLEVTQITALRVNEFRHTILFVSHNPSLQDKKLSYFTYENLPDNDSLHQILDPVFTDKVLNTLRENFEMWLKRGSGIHGSVGLAVTIGNKKLDGDWMWIGVPDPFNSNNNLNNLLTESIWLTGI